MISSKSKYLASYSVVEAKLIETPSENALLIEVFNSLLLEDQKFWIPLSQVGNYHCTNEEENIYEIEIKNWILENKGLEFLINS